MNDNGVGIDTRLARAGDFIDSTTGAAVPPIHMSTTFARDADYELMGDFVYRRYGSPTVTAAEEVLRALDEGSEALLFGSGLGAITSLLETLRSGDRVVAPRIMYHGAQDWLRRLVEVRGVRLTLFDAAEPGALERAVAQNTTTLVWVECPANPTWDVIDIAEAAEIAHSAGATLAVDSTVAPPVTTRALALGADFVFHSATKYLNGHSDVLGGVLVTNQVDDRWNELREIRKLTGGVMAPFDAWLLIRGLRTLAVRFDRCSTTALRIARHFEGHPAIEAVLYPGLESHPQHAVAQRQMTRGFGGMMSLMIRGDESTTRALATKLHCFLPATSLGGVESLVEHRASVEGPHSLVPKNLLRLSVGIEDPQDLIADLEAGLSSL